MAFFFDLVEMRIDVLAHTVHSLVQFFWIFGTFVPVRVAPQDQLFVFRSVLEKLLVGVKPRLV